MGGVKFQADRDIPDLTDQVIIVTGGNVGLGLETIRQLAKHNPARIYLAGRSEQKVQDAIKQLKTVQPDAPILPLKLDLASFASIKTAAASFMASESRLDVLINNAGVMMLPPGLTEEGYEIQFGTNVIGPTLFTQLLPPIIQDTSKINPQARVVNLSSASEKVAPKDLYPFDDLKTDLSQRHTTARYSMSKIANIHYTSAAAKRYTDVKFISVHPGMVATNLHHGSTGLFLKPFLYTALWLFATPVEKGALSQIWAAVIADAKSGEYYAPIGKIEDGSVASQDTEVAEQLWAWLQKELERHLS